MSSSRSGIVSVACSVHGVSDTRVALRPATQRRDQVALVAERHPGEHALMQVARQRRARRSATGPTAQSQTQTSAMRAGVEAADLVAEAERLARRRASPRAAPSTRSGARRPSPAPCRPRPSCAASTGWCRRRRRWRADTATPASLRPCASRTGRCRGTGSTTGSARSARRSSASAARSASSSQMPCASTARSLQQAGAAIDVEVAARLGKQLGHPAALRRGSRPRGSACRGRRRAAQQRARPSRAASGVLVGAKRTVTA